MKCAPVDDATTTTGPRRLAFDVLSTNTAVFSCCKEQRTKETHEQVFFSDFQTRETMSKLLAAPLSVSPPAGTVRERRRGFCIEARGVPARPLRVPPSSQALPGSDVDEHAAPRHDEALWL